MKREGDFPEKRLAAIRSDIQPVNQHGSGIRVIKTGYQPRKRGFPASRRPHDGNGFSAPNPKRDTGKDGRRESRVPEGDIPEFHFALRTGACRRVTVAESWRYGQNFPKTPPGGKTPGNHLRKHHENQNGNKKPPGVRDTRHDFTRCRRAGSRQNGAPVEERHHHETHQEIHRRAEKRKREQDLQLHPDQAVIGPSEADPLVKLAAESLDYADSGDIFLQDFIQLIEPRLQLRKKRFHPGDATRGAERHHRNRRKNNQPEFRIQAMHEVDASRNHERGADAAPDQLGNERLNLRDIVCHAGNQGAAPEGIKLRKGKPHNPPEHLLSHIVPDIL